MKAKKKRTKHYSGSGAAAPSTPVVHRYEAVERSRFKQWLYDNKPRIRIFGVLAAIAGVLTLLIDGIVTLFH